MSADLQLVRGEVDGFNLAIGEPVVIQEKLVPFISPIQVRGPLFYPCLGGEKELLSILQQAYPDSHVVITTGAKQAIEAAFFAFKTVEGKEGVSHTPPYWPSYPTLSKNQGLKFSNTPQENYIRVITSPNNPDGQENLSQADIHDAVYDSEVYGSSNHLNFAKVKIFSAAKMYGLSGLRVGWAVTENAKLAEAMAYYVEITTSGVAVSSQRILATVIEKMPSLYSFVFPQARADILMNGSLFNRYIARYCDCIDGVPETGRGMFAWFKVKEPENFRQALKDSRVFVVTGEACGASEDGWFRMSMGQNRDVTEKALKSLSNSLLKFTPTSGG